MVEVIHTPEVCPIISRSEARAQGLEKYFTGKPCIQGHISVRYLNSKICVECGRDRARRNSARENEKARLARAKNPEAVRAKARAYRLQNLERVRAKDKELRAKDRKKINARISEYRKTHPRKPNLRVYTPEQRARRKLWEAKNKEMLADMRRRWAVDNKEIVRQHRRNRRARIKGSAAQHTAKEIQALGIAQKWRCINCLKSLKKGYHADHINPLCRGGTNAISNIQLLCAPCNLKKNAKDPVVWAQEQGRLL